MAEAMIGGMLGQGFRPHEIRVADPSQDRRALLASRFGVALEDAPDDCLAVDVLVLAVKPQILRDVLLGLPPLAPDTCVLSIAAGVRATDISRWLRGHGNVVRAMPNTPALIGSGIAGLYALPGVAAPLRERAEQILGAVGTTLWVEDEARIDAVTAISGSGPAYVFLFIEALEEAAIELGLPADDARALALHTVHGAAALALRDGAEPAVLRARVTSKGGTTERGVATFEAQGLRAMVTAAARAAAERARELGDQLGSA